MCKKRFGLKGLIFFALCPIIIALAQEQNDRPPVSYKELESFQRDGESELWRNIVVSKDISADQLIELGTYLFKNHPRTRYNIFSDDTQFQAFKNWKLHFYKEDHDKFPWPERWLSQHHVATINRMANPPILEWRLDAVSLRYWKSDKYTLIVFASEKNIRNQ